MGGDSRERVREGGGRRERKLEKNVDGRRSRGARECLSPELARISRTLRGP